LQSTNSHSAGVFFFEIFFQLLRTVFSTAVAAGTQGDGARAGAPAAPLLMGADKKVTRERAVQIVDKAAQEASDVIAATQDPMKKPKQLKAAVKEEVAKLVESGDPGKVVQYIKGHKKEFISGVYMSWFMKEVRAQLEGGGSGAAAAKQEPAAASGKQAAAPPPKPASAAASANVAAKAPAPKAGGDAEPASKKQKVSVEGARPSDASADTGKSASGSTAATKAA